MMKLTASRRGSDVGHIGVDIPLPIEVRQPSEVGHRFQDRELIAQDQGIEMHRDHQDGRHEFENLLDRHQSIGLSLGERLIRQIEQMRC